MLCRNRAVPKIAARNIIRDGGEGVIMRKPGSPYEHGRNESLVKLKVYLYYLFIIKSKNNNKLIRAHRYSYIIVIIQMAREDREGLVVRVGRRFYTVQLYVFPPRSS